MNDKTPPAGWVIQATIPTAPKAGAQWIGPTMSSAPTFKYFNVAIAAPNQAVEAATKHLAKSDPTEREMRPVRGLSSGEIAALSLKAGAVEPA